MENNVRPINAHTFEQHLRDWQQDIENDYYIEPYKRQIISDTLQTAIEDLADNPVIEAIPVVHGRWITSSDIPDTLICSVCGRKYDMYHFDQKDMPFCLCGAKMDGGDDNG